EKRVQAVIGRLFGKEFSQIAQNDLNFATSIAGDKAFLDAFNSKDRDAMGKALKAYSDKTGLDAFITAIDNKGTALYGTDAPAKFGYSVAEKCAGVDAVMRKGQWYGFAAFSPTGEVTVSSMAQVKSGATMAGIVAVSHPISSEFLTGLVS